MAFALAHVPRALVLAMAFVGPVACESSSGGLGIGLPTFADRAATTHLPLAFRRAYLPDVPAAGSPRFIELVNGSDRTLALDGADAGLQLATAEAVVALPAVAWAPGAALRLEGESLAPLGLHRQLGEVAVLGADGTVHAYAAWGGDGATLPGGLGEYAQRSGFATAAAALPFPLADDQALLLTGQQAPGGGCTTAAADAAPPFAQESCRARPGATPPQLVRVVPRGATPVGAYLELYNPDPNVAVDPYGLRLCLASSGCQPLIFRGQRGGAAGLLAAGLAADSRRRLTLAGAAPLSADDWTSQLPAVQPRDEVALVTGASADDANGNQAGSLPAALAPGATLTYVRLDPAGNQAPAWSTPSVLQQGLADEDARARWQAQALPAPRLSGEGLVCTAEAAGAQVQPLPSDWRLEQLDANAPLPAADAPATACSQPLQPAPATVVIDALMQLGADEARVVLRNLDATQAQDLSAAEVRLAGQRFALTDAPSLAPDATLWLNITRTGACQAVHDLCWADTTASLAAGSLQLRQATGPVAHLQWGQGNAADGDAAASEDSADEAALRDAAVTAGVWPGAHCRQRQFDGNTIGTRLRRIASRPGQGSGDYAADDLADD